VFVLSNTTVTNNSAKIAGGLFQTGAGSITLRNSILAGNSASTVGPDCNGPIASQEHNLAGVTAGCTFAASTGDLLNVSANLGPTREQRRTHPDACPQRRQRRDRCRRSRRAGQRWNCVRSH
jgi:hypothetical protein